MKGGDTKVGLECYPDQGARSRAPGLMGLLRKSKPRLCRPGEKKTGGGSEGDI